MSMDGEDRPADFSDFPDKLPAVNINDNGGEVSLSIEETNKLRIALGLKPLSLEPKQPPPLKVKEVPKTKAADDLKARIEQARLKRKEEELRAVKGLGVADEADDDLYSWAQRIRPDAEPAVDESQQKRKKARHADDSDEDMEEAQEQGFTAEELARLKVKHDYGELVEGESVILTLADKGILDEQGELDEDDGTELENVLMAEQKKRTKAYDAAVKKAKPLFEEDGKKRSLLDKYDEEEEQALQLADIAGEAAKQRHQEEVRKKLAAGAESILGAKPLLDGGADFMSSEEAAKLLKPKRKKKKLRVKEKVSEEGLDLELLEEQAAAEGTSNLGSRASRQAAREKAEADEAQQRQDKAARFEAALEKANWASEALREAKPEPVLVLGDDADDELQESLARARRAALQQAAGADTRMKEMAERIAVKREEEEKEAVKSMGKNDLEFTETTEFVRSIQSTEGGEDAKKEDDGYMGVDEEERAPAPPPSMPPPESKKQKKRGRVGAWVAADDMDVDEQVEVKEEPKEQGQKKPRSKEEEELEGITAQQLVGRGLAATLSLLKDTGALRQKMEWAGRTNDKKKNKLEGLEDVYSGGMSEDRLARDIEVALTQRDEFGRILTPKERFRELSYKFHGKAPSKNKLEKKQKQAREEIATKRAATSENPSSQLGMLKQVQQQQGLPYVVLSGPRATMPPPASKGSKPSRGGARDVSKGNIALTPVLGGGLTPLTDPTKKVEMMYGIKKPGTAGTASTSGTGSMGPPPPRRPQA